MSAKTQIITADGRIRTHFAARTDPSGDNPRGFVEGDVVYVEWNPRDSLVAERKQVDGLHQVVRTFESQDRHHGPALVFVPVGGDVRGARWGGGEHLMVGAPIVLGLYEPTPEELAELAAARG